MYNDAIWNKNLEVYRKRVDDLDVTFEDSTDAIWLIHFDKENDAEYAADRSRNPTKLAALNELAKHIESCIETKFQHEIWEDEYKKSHETQPSL